MEHTGWNRGTRWQGVFTLAAVLVVMGCGETYDEGGELESGEVEVPPPMETVETPYAYGQWDMNTDRVLDRDEFGTWVDEQDWDAWDEESFTETTFSLWDENDDGVLTESEWRESTDRWYGADVDFGVWADWDGDGDSELDANEVRESMEAHGLYDRVDGDSDALIDDEELADWWFDIWDFNDDDEIDTTEWDWGEEYGYTEID